MFGMVVKFVGKGENAGYQHFLLFTQVLKSVTVFFSLCKMDFENLVGKMKDQNAGYHCFENGGIYILRPPYR